MHIGVTTNDIFTREDQEFLIRNGALPAERIRAIETGGCPHAAIREDVSANLGALEELQVRTQLPPPTEALTLATGSIWVRTTLCRKWRGQPSSKLFEGTSRLHHLRRKCAHGRRPEDNTELPHFRSMSPEGTKFLEKAARASHK